MKWKGLVLLGCLPGLIAVFVLTDVVRTFDFSKHLFFRTFVLLSSLLIILRGLWFGYLKIPTKRFSNHVTIVLGLMLLVVFMATMASPQMLNSLWGNFERGQGLIPWAFYLLYFCLLLLCLSRESVKRSSYWILGFGGLVAAYAVFQKMGFDPIFASFNVDFLEGRVFSTLGNPDFLAQFLAPLIVYAVYLSWNEKRWIYLPLILVLLFALVFTESRASFLAVIFSLTFMFVHLTKNKKRLFFAFTAFLILMIVGASLHLPLFDRFQINSENFRSMESRVILWDVATRVILDNPILGIGPDNFAIRFPEYLSPEFYVLEDDLNISGDRAHNEVLDMGLIGGIPMMLLYLALIFLILRSLYLHKNPKSLDYGFALALITIAMQNQLSFPQITDYVLWIFLLAAWVIYREPDDVKELTFSKPFRFVSPLIVVAFVFFVFVESVLFPLQAEAWYAYALGTDDTKHGLMMATNYAPLEPEFRYNLLMWFPEEMETELGALHLIEGDSIDVLAWMANSYIYKDPEKAYEIFEELIEINPEYPHTVRAYADALYVNEEYERAVDYYEQYLLIVPEFWSWCPELSEKSAYEQKKYRIFYKNVHDFNNSLVHLYESYEAIGAQEDLEILNPYMECHGLTSF